MKNLISIRPLSGNACSGFSRVFEANNIFVPEGQLLQYVADGRSGIRSTVIAEVQTHAMAPAGLASVRFGSREGELGGSGRPAELTDLIVLPQYRRNGIASKLLDVIERDISEKVTWLVLRAEKFHSPEAGQAVVSGRGYLPVALKGSAFHGDSIAGVPVSPGSYWAKRLNSRTSMPGT